MEYLTMNNFLLLYYKKNRFHVAEDPFSSKSQKKLKFGKNINISLGCASCATLYVATAHASSFYAIGLMDRDTFTEGFRRPSDHDRFSSAHDYAGSKFDKHPISVDFTGYKNTSKRIVF